MAKPEMRFSRDGKRIILNSAAIEQHCYVETIENDYGSVFKLMSADGKRILQAMN